MAMRPPLPQHCQSALLAFLLVVTLCTFEASARTGPAHDRIVVCYVSTWAVYRPGQGAYSISNFDANLCTHVIHAFAGLDDSKSAIKSIDPWQDLKENYGKGGFELWTGLKRTHPHLKVTLAIGGWKEGSLNYSIMAENTTLRGNFVRQASSFIRTHNFDGLDLDWEYPTQREGRPQDRQNFVALTRELREEFDKHGLLLSSAIGAAENVMDQAYDLPELSKHLHFLHIMSYDYHGSWEKKIGYNSPLRSDTPGDTLTVEHTIEYLLKHGAPASKLVLGLPFYGRTFITRKDGNVDDAVEDTGFKGPFTREEGFLGYNEICALTSNKSADWTTSWHPDACQAIARSPRDALSNEVHVVSYDNSRAIANKVKFAMSKKLAGLMVWSVDTDDFLGECAPEEDTYEDYKFIDSRVPHRVNHNYPLLRTINEAVLLAAEELSHEAAEYEDETEPPVERATKRGKTNGAAHLGAFGMPMLFVLNMCLVYFK